MFWKRIVLFVMLLSSVFVLAGYSFTAKKGREILVSAAISLKEAPGKSVIYEKQTGIRVQFNFGASGLLQKQINVLPLCSRCDKASHMS
jgi:ABC-type molybdate transport system substrate-binding protein